jgi:heterodisulfide reductase subunit B
MGFDDPDEPESMDLLIETLGAETVDYSMKTKCCGASLMGTEEKMALGLCRDLLMDARKKGAHCIVTLCPLCQMNLDIYQPKVNSLFGTDYRIPVIYFTQLIGLALGSEPEELGMKRLGVKVSGEMKRIIEGA